MKKYAVIPNQDQHTVGSNYIVSLPNNLVVNVEAQTGLNPYTDFIGQNHERIDFVVSKFVERDPWTQTQTDEVNALWGALGKPDQFIRIDEDPSLPGKRYDTLEKVVLTENRQYEIWEHITTREIIFTSLDQANTDFAIISMNSNAGNAVDGFKYVEFNTKPSPSRIIILQNLATNEDLTVKYFDDAISDFVIIV